MWVEPKFQSSTLRNSLSLIIEVPLTPSLKEQGSNDVAGRTGFKQINGFTDFIKSELSTVSGTTFTACYLILERVLQNIFTAIPLS